MRRFYILLILCLVAVAPVVSAKDARIVKVLPQFLDRKGRNAISPSLYERDVYQLQLRQHPEQRSALAFFVQWKGGKNQNLTVRVEMRGVYGNLLQVHNLEEPVKKDGWFTTWSVIKFGGEEYKSFGDLTAWRATLWDGERMLSEQKSFLW